MSTLFLGVDIAKDTFDVHFLDIHKPKRSKTFKNTIAGFKAMRSSLPEHEQLILGLESTGIYHLELAHWAHEQGWTVFVLNPANARKHHDVISNGHKTDALDAWALAEYVRQCHHLLRPFVPEAPIWRQARELNHRRKALIRQRVRETNRFETVSKDNKFLKSSLKRTVRMLEKEIVRVEKALESLMREDEAMSQQLDLSQTIPGVGEVLSKTLTVELGDLSQYANAKAMTAIVGLVPFEKSSGTSVRGKKKKRRRGKERVRAVLYMAALSAFRHPDWADWIEKRQSNGKTGMKLVVAVMDKLLRICFGVVKSGLPYDKNIAFAT